MKRGCGSSSILKTSASLAAIVVALGLATSLLAPKATATDQGDKPVKGTKTPILAPEATAADQGDKPTKGTKTPISATEAGAAYQRDQPIVETTASISSPKAIAADLGTYKPAAQRVVPLPIAPVMTWTGFYVGGHLGGFWSDINHKTSQSGTGYFIDANAADINQIGNTDLDPDGFQGGIQAGYNLQSGNVVYGIEADLRWLDGDGSRTITREYPAGAPATYTLKNSADIDWLVTVRPRIGFASNQTMVYLTGGLAIADISARNSFTDDFVALSTTNGSATEYGWTLGGGLEYAISNNWSIKGEYLYVDFGDLDTRSSTLNFNNNEVFAFRNDDFSMHVLSAGLNYRF